MSFDDAARQAADALGTQVGRILQEQLQQFVTVVADAAARERTALTEQAQQAVTAAEQTLESAVARAREEAAQDTESRLEAAFTERSAQAAAAAEAARAEQDATRSAHETERAQWADRAARLEADLTERQQRDADLVARAEQAEADRVRADAEWQARAEQLEARLAEQAAQAAEAHALAAQAQAQADAQAEAHAQALAQVQALTAAGADAQEYDPAAGEDAATPSNILGFPTNPHGAGAGIYSISVSSSSPASVTAFGSPSAAAFESSGSESDAATQAAASAAAAATAAASAALERLVAGFRALDEGQSLSQLLDTLATQVARNATRSAVFVVRGQARQGAVLQGWAFSGFSGAPLDARSLSVPLEKLPALADVVLQGGRSDVRTAGFAAADVNPLAFMSVPRTLTGVAVPVLVGGQVAAVVYGDDGGIVPGAVTQEDRSSEVSFEPAGPFVSIASASSEVGASAVNEGESEPEASLVGESPSAESVAALSADAEAEGIVAKPAAAAVDVVAAFANWADALELLARHAARCLEAQTAIRAARLSSSAPPAPVVQASSASAGPGVNAAGSGTRNGHASDAASADGGDAAGDEDAAAAAAREAAAAAEAYAEEHARRYARLLIADIRLYNEAAVRAGREHRDLWHRLQPDIARARRAFEDRVNDVADRERLFDEELVRTLADGDEALLGFDLMRPPSSSAERLAV